MLRRLQLLIRSTSIDVYNNQDRDAHFNNWATLPQEFYEPSTSSRITNRQQAIDHIAAKRGLTGIVLCDVCIMPKHIDELLGETCYDCEHERRAHKSALQDYEAEQEIEK